MGWMERWMDGGRGSDQQLKSKKNLKDSKKDGDGYIQKLVLGKNSRSETWINKKSLTMEREWLTGLWSRGLFSYPWSRSVWWRRKKNSAILSDFTGYLRREKYPETHIWKVSMFQAWTKHLIFHQLEFHIIVIPTCKGNKQTNILCEFSKIRKHISWLARYY